MSPKEAERFKRGLVTQAKKALAAESSQVKSSPFGEGAPPSTAGAAAGDDEYELRRNAATGPQELALDSSLRSQFSAASPPTVAAGTDG